MGALLLRMVGRMDELFFRNRLVLKYQQDGYCLCSLFLLLCCRKKTRQNCAKYYKNDRWFLMHLNYSLLSLLHNGIIAWSANKRIIVKQVHFFIIIIKAILNPNHKIPFPAENVDPLLLDVLKSCLNRWYKTPFHYGQLFTLLELPALR